MKGLIDRLLQRYDEAEYITALKARFLLYLCAFGLLIIPCIILYTALLHGEMPEFGDMDSFALLAPTSLFFLLVVLSLVLLVKGHFTLSAHIIFVMAQSAVWMVMYVDKSPALPRLNSIVLVIAILALAPIVISRWRFVIPVYAAVNILFLYLFMEYQAVQLALPRAQAWEHFADNTAAILVISFISYNLFTITGQALRHADLSRKRLAVSNEELAATNEELQATLEELEATNEEFEAQNSALVRSDEELRASQSELLAVFNGSHDSLIIHDENGRILDVNDRMLSMYGISRPRALAAAIVEISSTEMNMDDGRRFMARAFSGEDMVFEWKALRPIDGSVFDVEVGMKRLMKSGRNVLLASVRDISARKWAERALVENERKYRMIAENAVDIIFTLDMDFRFTYISPSVQRVRGYTVEEAMVQGFDQALTPASLVAATEAMLIARHHVEIQDTSRTINLELEEYCSNGSTIWTENEFSFMKDDTGRPIGILGVTRNISDRKKTREMIIERAQRVEKQMKAIGMIASSESIRGSELLPALRAITEIVAGCFDVNRAGIRLLNDDATLLRCVDLFERDSAAHISGMDLPRDQFRNEIDYLVNNPYMDAHDAMNDPRTRGYRETYLVPNGISSMLDAAIRLSGKTAGIVCIEHVGPQRSWYADEIIFACTIADQVVQVLLHMERITTENALRESETSYRMLSAYNERLNEIYITLTEADTLEILFERIARSFRSLTGAITSTSSYYNPANGSLEIAFADAGDELIKKVEAVIGLPVFGISMRVPEEIIPLMLTDVIKHFRSFEECSFGAISREASSQAMELLGCGEIIIIVLQYESELFGTTAAYLPRQSAVVHEDALKTFAYMAGLAITRKKTEVALRQSTERLQTVIGSVPLVLFALDSRGIFTLAEGAGLKRLGLTRAEGEDSSAFDIYRDAPELLGVVREAFSGKQQRGEIRIGDLWYEAWVNPVLDDAGTVTGAMGVATDITERKHAEEDRERIQGQLLQAQKMEAVGTLAGGIAHDFNNMLGGVMGSLDVVGLLLEKETLSQKESIMKFLETALESSRRAADLTRQMLTLSRKSEIQMVAVDITVSLARVLSLCQNSFPKSVALNFEIPGTPIKVHGDPTHIEQVLLNLCVNASHAMTLMRGENEKPGGTLSVGLDVIGSGSEFLLPHGEAAPEGPYVRIRVSDTGVGMNEEVRTRIFEPFFTVKKMDEGTGLGLAMVYSIIKQHKGFIDVYSEPGIGSSFTVYLPLLPVSSAGIEKPRGVEGLTMGSGLLLAIDDEKAILRIAKGMLEHCGYEVLTADNGEAGVALFKKEHPRIRAVILDLSMPGISGLEVYAYIREINPGIRVLLTSGLMEDDSMTQARDMGIMGFLQKPYSAEELSAKIAEILNQ